MKNIFFEKLKKTKIVNLIRKFKRKEYRRRWLWKVNFHSGIDFESVNGTFDCLFDNLKKKEKRFFLGLVMVK